jgi:hypothetical protein
VLSVVEGCNQECTVGGTEPTVHSWLHPSTTDNTGRIVIHTHPPSEAQVEEPAGPANYSLVNSRQPQ